MSQTKLPEVLSPLGKVFSMLPRSLLARAGSSFSIRVSQPGGHLLLGTGQHQYIISLICCPWHIVPTPVLSLTRFLVRSSHFIGDLRSHSSIRIVHNGFTSTREKGQHRGPLEMPCSMYAHVYVPVPVRGRLRHHWWSSSHEGILAGMFGHK
jgi:hypothetical protein